MKKLLSAILALVMVFGLFGVMGSAALAGEEAPKTLTVLFTGGLGNTVRVEDGLSFAAAAALKDTYEDADEVLLVDAGGFAAGSAAIMTAAGYDLVVPDEVIDGWDITSISMGVSDLKAGAMFNKGNIKIAFIGVTPIDKTGAEDAEAYLNTIGDAVSKAVESEADYVVALGQTDDVAALAAIEGLDAVLTYGVDVVELELADGAAEVVSVEKNFGSIGSVTFGGEDKDAVEVDIIDAEAYHEKGLQENSAILTLQESAMNSGDEDKSDEGEDKSDEGEDKSDEGEDKSDEGEDKSDEGEDKSGEGEDKSGEGEDKSDEGEDKSDEGADKSDEGEDKSDEGEDKSGEGEDKSGEGEDKSGEGEDKSGEGEDKSDEGADKSDEGEDKSDEGEDKSGEGEDKSDDEKKDDESASPMNAGDVEPASSMDAKGEGESETTVPDAAPQNTTISWVKGSDDLVITMEHPIAKIIITSWNNNVLESKYYSLSNGDKTVSIFGKVLNDWGNGNHVFSFEFTDGAAAESRTVNISGTAPAKTDTTIQVSVQSNDDEVIAQWKSAGLDPDQVKKALSDEIVKKDGFTAANVKYYDVTSNASAQDITAAGGVSVTLPYPGGTTADGYDFVVAHRKADGSVEIFDIGDGAKTSSGIQIKEDSLSPFAVGYKSKTAAQTNSGSKSPATGDETPIWLFVLIFAVLVAALAVVIVLVVRKNKKKQQDGQDSQA